MAAPRITRVLGVVNLGSFRVSAMVAGQTEAGELLVLGARHRAAQGIKRGYVTDMAAATFAVRDAIERAEKMAQVSVGSVWVGAAGAGLASQNAHVELPIGGRRIELDDVNHLLFSARDVIQPDGRTVLHAQPAHYTLDGAHGVANAVGLHAEQLGVDIHVMLADGAPIRNITEAVQNAHLSVEAVVASPIAVGHACLTTEERELGVALIEFGAEVTNVSVHAAGMLVGLIAIPYGSGDITDAIASAFGIKRFQAERLKCVHGSAIASPADHRELIPVNAPGEEALDAHVHLAGQDHRIPRAELIGVITAQLDIILERISRALKDMGFAGARGQQVVLTGGGAELAGVADYAQAALGKPVRIGRPLALVGLPEAYASPGFSALAGLVLYAAADPVDIRSLGGEHPLFGHAAAGGLFRRISNAAKAYF